MEDHLPQRVRVERRAVSEEESRRANGPDWDRYADEYQATHGGFLGNTGFVWGPEGLTEDEAGVLGDVSADRTCSRWGRAPVSAPAGCASTAARRTGSTSPRASSSTRGASTRSPASPSLRCGPPRRRCPSPTAVRRRVLLVRCDAVHLRPRRRAARGGTGAPPGGRFAFSITHPTRWSFPDDPSEAGLTAASSYWDRTPYVEVDDESGRSPTSSTTGRSATGWRCWRPRLPDRRAARARVARGPRPGVGRLVAGPGQDHARGRRCSPSTSRPEAQDVAAAVLRLRDVRKSPTRNSGTPTT